MFLKALRTRNRPFLEAAVALHRAGRVPARAFIVPIAGVGSGRPEAKGVWMPDGRPAASPSSGAN